MDSRWFNKNHRYAAAGHEHGAETPDSYTQFHRRVFQTVQTCLIDQVLICSAIPKYRR